MKPNFLQFLWEKIKKAGERKGCAADDSQNPPATMPPYRYRAIQHHPTAQEKQHRAAEQSYWQEQLRLAKELNVLTKWLNWVTVGATVAAGLAAFAGFISLYILNDTLRETRKATVAATTAADAAKLSAQVAEKTLTLGERPWVVISEATVDSPFAPGQEIKVQFEWKNVGRTPATGFEVWTVLGLILTPKGRNDIPECSGYEQWKSASTLGPGLRAYAPVAFAFEAGERSDAIQQERKTIIVCGMATYRDVVSSPSPLHHTSFCFLYRINTKDLVPCPKEDIID